MQRGSIRREGTWSSASAASCCLAQPLSDSLTSAPACSYLRCDRRSLDCAVLVSSKMFTATAPTATLQNNKYQPKLLLVPLVKCLLGLLHGLIDAQEVLIAERIDGLSTGQLKVEPCRTLEPQKKGNAVASDL